HSCMVYTGPFRNPEECMYCKEPRYEPITDPESASDSDSPESNRQAQTPCKTFTTMPIGPRLQALWHHPDTAQKLQHHHTETQRIIK
ncbi:hypothetical protein C8J56DRAFT_786383, partial [Mycena floridula]